MQSTVPGEDSEIIVRKLIKFVAILLYHFQSFYFFFTFNSNAPWHFENLLLS